MRIYLVNVGANASHGRLFSPIFEDGTFEFLPIPEVGDFDKPRRAVRYRDLPSYNKRGGDLHEYVPEDKWDAACHNDPDLKEFTYGDNPGVGRSGALKALRPGDVLLFLARLKHYETRQAGFYLVGGLRVDYARYVTPNSNGRKRFANNAHARRGDDRFWGVAGSDRSRRFKYAVPITKKICDRVFRDKNEEPWSWDGKSELATIGSYTRSIRCMLDTASSQQAKRVETLRRWIKKHSGGYDAELLDVTLYSYIVASDSGFAPNPFHGFCTLACCKPNIRRTAHIGDYVLGLRPKHCDNRVVYAMQVTDTMELNDYWKRFPVKHPDKGAGGVKAVGDNIYHIKARVKLVRDDIYHRDNADNWVQESSQHKKEHKGTDIGGRNALISLNFVYWGGKEKALPGNLKGLIPGRGHRSAANKRFISPFIKWFESHEEKGRLEWPTDSSAIERTSTRRRRC